MWSLINKITRKKIYNPDTIFNTDLKRCLSLLDITFLGLGHTVGAGLYLVIGMVAKTKSGPAVCISYAMAGVAALFSGLSYAELGTRVPRAGSAYAYNIIAIGELWGFIVGWNMVLENVINIASVARTFSGYVDSLCNGVIKKTTLSIMGTHHVAYIASYIDVLATLFVILSALFLMMSVQKSSIVNKFFTSINLLVVAVTIIMGFYYADWKNWSDEKTGGFFPFGFTGAIAGAGPAFFGYVGFENVASAAEEAKHPSKMMPRALFLVVVLATVTYVLVGCALTLMVPYNMLDENASIAHAFLTHGSYSMSYVVTVGAIAAMTATSICSLYGVSRVIYAMATDGVFFSTFTKITSESKVPTRSVLLAAIFSAFVTCLLDLELLIEFLSIGTLLAYTMVNICVILLHYEKDTVGTLEESSKDVGELHGKFSWVKCFCKTTVGPQYCVKLSLFGFVSSIIVFLVTTARKFEYIQLLNPWAIIISSISGAAACLFTFLIAVHRKDAARLSFKVPCIPLVPLIGVVLNLLLMVFLQGMSWIRLLVWQAIGLVIYFGYGIRHSKLEDNISETCSIDQPLLEKPCYENTQDPANKSHPHWNERSTVSTSTSP